MKQGARKYQAGKLLGISLRTIERWEREGSLEDKRKTRIFIPLNKLTKAEEEKVLDMANSKRFCDLPPSQIVPILAEEGIYIASESTFYRLLRKKGQLAHRQRCQPRQYNKPKTLIATQSNQVWSWDITYLPSRVRGLFFYLYMVIDIYSRKIVGFEVSDRETSDIASACVEQACRYEKINKDQLSLHSDNGSPMKGATLLSTLQYLGVTPSYNRPGVSNDNPFSESLFKTMKYHRCYPEEVFDDIEGAKAWVIRFTDWYNNEHRHSALKFVTPDQKHRGNDKDVLAVRARTYRLAQRDNPARWSKGIRNWTPVKFALLNPDSKMRAKLEELNEDDFIHKMRQVA